MSSEIKTTSQEELATDINVITAEINAYQRVAGEAIFEIGRRLKHVKENDLAHGEFGKWLESVGIAPRQAQRFIKVYERFGKTTPGTQLPESMRVLSELTSLTDEELAQEYELPNGEKKKPTEMSRREIEELKRKLKAEKAERERLERENEELSNRPPRIEYIQPKDYATVKAENVERFFNIDIKLLLSVGVYMDVCLVAYLYRGL